MTVVDGRSGGRVERKMLRFNCLQFRGEVGLKKTKMLTVVNGRRGERVGSKNAKVLLDRLNKTKNC